mmetsp:Transcript_27597/g.43455  ORF Transcript_27597/g.43455 Transcript_27597/m.43455 type:complete len:245 (+) Transcript_27597:307-1041(+)
MGTVRAETGQACFGCPVCGYFWLPQECSSPFWTSTGHSPRHSQGACGCPITRRPGAITVRWRGGEGLSRPSAGFNSGVCDLGRDWGIQQARRRRYQCSRAQDANCSATDWPATRLRRGAGLRPLGDPLPHRRDARAPGALAAGARHGRGALADGLPPGGLQRAGWGGGEQRPHRADTGLEAGRPAGRPRRRFPRDDGRHPGAVRGGGAALRPRVPRGRLHEPVRGVQHEGLCRDCPGGGRAAGR